MEPDDLTMRPITGPAELGLFNQLPYVLNEELADDLADGRRQPEWMWLALRGGRLVARAAWWTRTAGDAPLVLDILDVDDTLPGPARLDTGERLLRTAMAATIGDRPRPAGYGRFVPPDWRDSPASTVIVGDRMTIAERTGARLLVERLGLEWRPGTPVPGSSGRLLFRPVRATGELLELMTLVLDGTLDAHHREDLTRMSARETAATHYQDELALYSSPREWWRIAALPGGESVGFVIPARNPYGAIIAYLGVLPAHRGHGYIDDILAEGTRVLAGEGVPRIRASTDLGNVPMANAFRRAGYVIYQREINMTWD
jgi:RimJ/RimL family protein N-acetyltransferase